MHARVVVFVDCDYWLLENNVGLRQPSISLAISPSIGPASLLWMLCQDSSVYYGCFFSDIVTLYISVT
jgi:hypothetical protein